MTRPTAPANPPDAAPPRVLLTFAEALDALRLSERTLRDLTAPRGPIPVVKVGRLVRYRPAALEAWAAGLEQSAAGGDAIGDDPGGAPAGPPR